MKCYVLKNIMGEYCEMPDRIIAIYIKKTVAMEHLKLINRWIRKERRMLSNPNVDWIECVCPYDKNFVESESTEYLIETVEISEITKAELFEQFFVDVL